LGLAGSGCPSTRAVMVLNALSTRISCALPRAAGSAHISTSTSCGARPLARVRVAATFTFAGYARAASSALPENRRVLSVISSRPKPAGGLVEVRRAAVTAPAAARARTPSIPASAPDGTKMRLARSAARISGWMSSAALVITTMSVPAAKHARARSGTATAGRHSHTRSHAAARPAKSRFGAGKGLAPTDSDTAASRAPGT